MLSALFALVAVKYVVTRLLAVPSATDLIAKEGKVMKRVKVMLASVLDTFHGLGVGGLASCLLTKDFSAPSTSMIGWAPNNSFKPKPLRYTKGMAEKLAMPLAPLRSSA